MSVRPLGLLPVDGATLRRADAADAPELLVLQRCCWVDEAVANDTLDIPALHETLDDVRTWVDVWATWCVRLDGRLIGAVRAHEEDDSWEIGRLMVAPDFAGRGLGGWLLRLAEDQAPTEVESIMIFTGLQSARNIAIYEGAGFRPTVEPAPPAAVRLVKVREPHRH